MNFIGDTKDEIIAIVVSITTNYKTKIANHRCYRM